jgi:predicted RNase H-like HicB family nuclease
LKLKVLVRPENNGGYSVSVPALPGCHSEGETLDEALANIREAADLWLEVAEERATRESQILEPDAELQEIDL